jgi:hypothetical protein
MEVIVNFADGHLEITENVRSITNFETGLEIRDNGLHVTRYEKSEIRNVEIVWR